MISYSVLIFRLIIFILSFLGIAFFIYDKLDINPSFVPIITISAITIFIFISGLLNILILSTFFLLVLGCTLFIVYFIKSITKKFKYKSLITPGTVFFTLVSIYFYFLLYPIHYLQYDNFSHWGTIVKEMFYYNSFPDERSIVIFRNYPPGTATFIYYVCKILNFTEGNALFAQSLFLTASLSTIFCRVKFKDITAVLSLFFTALVSMCIIRYYDGTLSIYNLLVDFVLSVVFVAAVIFLYYYRNDIKKSLIPSILLLSTFILIKDNAKIFLIPIYLMVSIFLLRDYSLSYKNKAKYFAVLIFFPLLINQLWVAYVKKAYLHYDFSNNKFVLSSDKLFRLINAKSIAIIMSAVILILTNCYIAKKVKSSKIKHQKLIFIFPIISTLTILYLSLTYARHLFSKDRLNYNWIIFKNIIETVTNIDLLNTKIIIFTNLFIIIAMITLRILKKDIKLILKAFTSMNALLIFYILNLYFFYIFIMPKEESMILDGLDRYLISFIIMFELIQLLATIYQLQYISVNNKYLRNIAIGIIPLVILFPVYNNMRQFFIRPVEFEFARYQIKNICDKNKQKIPRDSKVLLYYTPSNGSMGYCYYVATYELLTREACVINNEDLKNNDVKNLLNDKEYLLIVNDNSNFWGVISRNNILVDNSQSSLYKVIHSADNIKLIAES